jgi:hypothetical protein
MATAEEVHEYVESLPPIYREILRAFPRIQPNRKAGYGLGFQTLAADFERERLGFALGEIILACQELQRQGLVQIQYELFVHPTERGERLIAAITGRETPPVTVPPLPVPPDLG